LVCKTAIRTGSFVYQKEFFNSEIVDEITGYHLNRQNSEQADVLIHPDLGRIHWANFHNMDGMIKIGKTTTENLLPDIKRTPRRKKFYFS
jgi:hypothetical protein